ncbi:MAG TPA: SH3 domain-containing protein, partial [Chondromyces sp.]|nr:SH3 domain-containing protein [Chondromyces sp.]
MIKKAGSIFIILFLLISVLSSFSLEAEAEEGSITIAVNTANIRKGPSLSDPVVGQAKRGETFTYSQKKYDWYEIQLSNGEKGWLAGWLVKQQTHVTASAHKEGIINADGLRLRSGPGEHHSVIGTLKSEEKVQIIGEQDYWYQISSSAGKGYVHMDYVKSAASGQATESDTIEEINLPSASKGTITGDR